MKFCRILAGKATLGSPKEEKERIVDEREHEYVTKGFWLGNYPVTQADGFMPMLQPYAYEKMELWPVSQRVNSVKGGNDAGMSEACFGRRKLDQQREPT
jgi:hypothetical protein